MSPRRTDVAMQTVYGPFMGLAGAGSIVGNTPANTAVNRQAWIEQVYIQILCELAANRYKWTGLPESINPRFLEMTLLQNALSVFYYDEGFGQYFALRGTPSGELNMQDDPIIYTVNGNRFINKQLRAMPYPVQMRNERGQFTDDYVMMPEECVPIWANYLRMPEWNTILIYANRLSEIDRTIEINSKNARRPKVLAVDPNMRLSVSNLIRQIDEGQPVIEVNSATYDATVGGITAIDLGVNPDTIEKLQVARTRIWNECMGLLGINNANQDKRERLVASEVDANNDQVDSMRWVNLNARRQAAHMINIRYGLRVGVDFHVQEVAEPEPMVSSEESDTDEVEDGEE